MLLNWCFPTLVSTCYRSLSRHQVSRSDLFELRQKSKDCWLGNLLELLKNIIEVGLGSTSDGDGSVNRTRYLFYLSRFPKKVSFNILHFITSRAWKKLSSYFFFLLLSQGQPDTPDHPIVHFALPLFQAQTPVKTLVCRNTHLTKTRRNFP